MASRDGRSWLMEWNAMWNLTLTLRMRSTISLIRPAISPFAKLSGEMAKIMRTGINESEAKRR